jgi:hypothetical protein
MTVFSTSEVTDHDLEGEPASEQKVCDQCLRWIEPDQPDGDTLVCPFCQAKARVVSSLTKSGRYINRAILGVSAEPIDTNLVLEDSEKLALNLAVSCLSQIQKTLRTLAFVIHEDSER